MGWGSRGSSDKEACQVLEVGVPRGLGCLAGELRVESVPGRGRTVGLQGVGRGRG